LYIPVDLLSGTGAAELCYKLIIPSSTPEGYLKTNLMSEVHFHAALILLTEIIIVETWNYANTA